MDFPDATRICPNCDAVAATPLPEYSRAGWVVASCEACAFVYLKNPPDSSKLVEDFAWEKTFEQEAQFRKERSPIVHRINQATRFRIGIFRKDQHKKMEKLLGGGEILDIGCGGGRRMKAPIIPFGIEISRQLWSKADAYMRGLGGYCLHTTGSSGVWKFPAGKFDAIIMHSYLEHETEVLETLRGAANCLKPGGRIFVRVPNFGSLNRRVVGGNWCGFRYPDHVNYFTLSSLREIAGKAGFETKLVNKYNLILDDNIHALLSKNTANQGTDLNGHSRR